MENFNSVLTSYDTYNKSYLNELERNNNLDKSLLENDYGSFYNVLERNFKALHRGSAGIASDIAQRSLGLNNKISDFKNVLQGDSNLLENEKNAIISKYRSSVDKEFANPGANVGRSLEKVIQENKDNTINQFVKGIPENDKVIDSVTDTYDKTIQFVKNFGEASLGMSINSQLAKEVNTDIQSQRSKIPSEDLSKNNGILVRVFDANAPASSGNMSGQLSKEYIIPSINYYMSQNNDSFFNSTKTNLFRYLEFLGHIKVPQNTTMIEFNLESGSGARLYFAGEMLIDEFNQSAISSTSRVNYVQSEQKVPFKVQAYEGRDGTNSYLMLKWRLNRQGGFLAIPPEYYFLPNLKVF